jgi:hypothetical protein
MLTSSPRGGGERFTVVVAIVSLLPSVAGRHGAER